VPRLQALWQKENLQRVSTLSIVLNEEELLDEAALEPEEWKIFFDALQEIKYIKLSLTYFTQDTAIQTLKQMLGPMQSLDLKQLTITGLNQVPDELEQLTMSTASVIKNKDWRRRQITYFVPI
jgi:hypothetical protein